MSHPINTQFLETAAEEFDSYLIKGDVVGMESVVARLSRNGFDKEAKSLAEVATDELKRLEKLDDVEVDSIA